MRTRNELEHRVLKMLLFRDDPVLTALRLQFESAEVSDRKFKGAGFFREFHVPLGASRASASGT